MGYRQYLPGICPWWLRDPDGGGPYLEELGGAQDAELDLDRAGVQARFPHYAPPDGLALKGAERGVDRYPFDTDQTYANKTWAVWKTKPWAGTPRGILNALAAAGYDDVVFVPNKGRYFELSGDAEGSVVATIEGIDALYGGAYFRFDQDDGHNFARFVIIFYAVPAQWTNVQQVPTGATSPTLAEVTAIHRLVRKWKAARSVYLGTIVITSGQLFGYPVRTFGAGGTFGPGSSVFWTP